MKVSAKAEYACVAMLELASNRSESQPVRVKAIADAHGIPLRFLVQILLQLKATGLVASLRGASGGYQLARKPEDISLADIVNAIDRAPAPRAEVESVSPSVRAIRGVWREIQAEEQKMLEGISLAQLVQQLDGASAVSYQI
jgi:Rrf2 family protein